MSWTGESLDKDAALRSRGALEAGHRIRSCSVQGIAWHVRAEQNISSSIATTLPVGSINAGGALRRQPPKGQEMEDQYFGAIQRVTAHARARDRFTGWRPVKAPTSRAEPVRDRAGLRNERAPPIIDDDDGDDGRIAPKCGLSCLCTRSGCGRQRRQRSTSTLVHGDDLGNNLFNGATPRQHQFRSSARASGGQQVAGSWCRSSAGNEIGRQRERRRSSPCFSAIS